MEPNQTPPVYTIPGMAEFMAALEASRREAEMRTKQWEAEAEKREREAQIRAKQWEAEAEKREREAQIRAKQWEAEAEKRDREAEKLNKEAARRMAALEKKSEELNRQMGFMSNRLGEVMEALASVSVRRQLKKRGHAITTVNDNVKILSEKGETIAEIDVVLFNGGTVFLAETKTKLTSQMVDAHLKRIETVAANPQRYTEGKQLAGIVAAAVLPDAVATYAMKKGLLVIRPQNDVFGIVNPEGFVLRTW